MGVPVAEMDGYTRTKKSLFNGIVAVAVQVVSIVIGFFSRKLFLDYLGTEVLGLNTTAASLLNFLNLAELGISSAITVTLYKPLYSGDRESVRQIAAIHGWMYRRVALFIIGASIVLLPFLPLIFGRMELPMWYAYASFLVLLFSALLGYFVNYKQAVLTADQKDYKVQTSYRLIMVVKVLAQMAGVRYFDNPYVWWLAFEAVFAIIASIVLNVTIYREYPYLRERCVVDKPLRTRYNDVMVKTGQLFVHRGAHFIQLFLVAGLGQFRADANILAGCVIIQIAGTIFADNGHQTDLIFGIRDHSQIHGSVIDVEQ